MLSGADCYRQKKPLSLENACVKIPSKRLRIPEHIRRKKWCHIQPWPESVKFYNINCQILLRICEKSYESTANIFSIFPTQNVFWTNSVVQAKVFSYTHTFSFLPCAPPVLSCREKWHSALSPPQEAALGKIEMQFDCSDCTDPRSNTQIQKSG